MKRFLLVASVFIFGLILFSQELQHDAVAINIEVPVRVFKGDLFVDNLTIDDFEVYEEGKLQKIEAVYLIRKKDIEREESENYYLLYYSPKDYVIDGKFKRIEVEVKGDKYRVAHRAGYFAD
jgi:hypothetical protein